MIFGKLCCVNFIANVVLVSAFYAEHYNKQISCQAYIWTKSKFLGLSIGVHNIGKGIVQVLKYDEEYTCNFPNGYGRWVTRFSSKFQILLYSSYGKKFSSTFNICAVINSSWQGGGEKMPVLSNLEGAK